MAPEIDPHYIPAFSIEDVILDKDTGAPLSGGLVEFFRDTQRSEQKDVWQITGVAPNYTFVRLPNPMTLSAIGTFEDALGNPVIPYFLPFNPDGTPDLYYITVKSSSEVDQFDRQGQPFLGNSGTDVAVLSSISNEISNPQFAEVLFDTTRSNFTFTFGAVTNHTVNLAPDWDLVVSCPSSGSVVVNQLKPTGSVNIPSNPPTILNISSAGLSSLLLRQRIFGSPNLWGSTNASLGFVSASFVAKNEGASPFTLKMFYIQSNGMIDPIQIVEAEIQNNGEYLPYSGNVEIPVSESLDTFPNAYIDIYFDIPLNVTLDLTSVMIAFTGEEGVSSLPFDQESYERQIDHLFHYYRPELFYKPIPSYLVGWDFPLNPCQENGFQLGLGTVSSGANAGYYIADQTVLFQTVNNNFNMTQNNSGMTFTAVAQSTMALIQYLPAPQANEILFQRLAVALQGLVNTGTLIGTVNIYWTTSTVPTPGALITSVTNDTNGPLTVVSGGWNLVSRGDLGTARFTLNGAKQSFVLNGFDATSVSGIQNATFIAIVISFNNLSASQSVTLNYASLNGGDIATRPAPQSFDQVLTQCQYYCESSYAIGVRIGTANSYAGALTANMTVNPLTGFSTPLFGYSTQFGFQYKNLKLSNSPNVFFISPQSGTTDMVLARSFTNGTELASPGVDVNISQWNLGTKSSRQINYTPTNTAIKSNSAATIVAPNCFIQYQYFVDSRIGRV